MKQNYITVLFLIISAIISYHQIACTAAADSNDDDVQFLYKAMGRTDDGHENDAVLPSQTLDIQHENETGDGDHRQWSPVSPNDDHTDRLISFATEPGIPLPPNMIKFWMQRHYCKWQTYSMNVTRPGCEPVPVINRMCYGACGSISVGTENGLVHELCESCAAVFRDQEIRLNCEGGTKMTIIKVVDHCKCRPCEHRCN